jgi:dTDP-4-amino-4,6-dideoxygalactose transaminase
LFLRHGSSQLSVGLVAERWVQYSFYMGEQACAMKVPLLDLQSEYAELRDEILPALDRVCRNSSFVQGEEVEAFEREFADFCGVKHCVALSSGTAALHLGLLGLGVQSGDDVITTPNSFLATAEAITYCGARPVFVDIDPATANLDPQLIERSITPRTRAILPVHLYGRPADMDPIREIAARRNLRILEDAAQAHAARYRAQRVGSLGLAAAFSFYPTKNLGAYGEGGALTTNDDSVAKFARAARSHGQTARYDHEFSGFNYRMQGFQGAVLRIKLRRLHAWTQRRREIAKEYRRVLEAARLEMPHDDPRDECVYHQFVVYVNNRNSIIAQLSARGIDTAVHYPKPIHLQPAYSSLGYPACTFPRAERACERVLSLPLFPGMTAEQVNYVATSVLEVVGKK